MEWLLAKLDEKGWTREELARQAGMRSSVINNIVSRNKAMGSKVAGRIADALGVPQRDVLIMAGLLNDEGDIEDVKEEDSIREIRRLLDALDESKRDEARRIIKSVLREMGKRKPGQVTG